MNIRSAFPFFFTMILASTPGITLAKPLYSSERVNKTTFWLRVDQSRKIEDGKTLEGLERFWDQTARLLCESDDLFAMKHKKRLNNNGKESPRGKRVVYGYAYCNSKISDTRELDYERKYEQYAQIPMSDFSFVEANPYWEHLMEGRYQDLNAELDNFYRQNLNAQISDDDLSSKLGTFSRVNFEAEKKFTEWIASGSETPVPYIARALYYHNYSWFKRGTRLWKDVTEEQRAGLKKYRTLALADIDTALGIDDRSCPALALRLQILISMTKEVDYPEEYKSAELKCPRSIAIRMAYMRYLEPRWSGSPMEAMKSFVDRSINEDDKFQVLQAQSLSEQARQLFEAGNNDAALEKFEQALAIQPMASIYSWRGQIYENLDQVVSAVENYVLATEMAPYSNTAYKGLTRTLLRQGNLTGAAIAASYLLAMNSQEPRNHATLGSLFYEMRRYYDAAESYRRALLLGPANEAYYKHLLRKAEFQMEIRLEKPNETGARSPVKA